MKDNCCQTCGKDSKSNTELKFINDSSSNIMLCEECISHMHNEIINKKEELNLEKIIEQKNEELILTKRNSLINEKTPSPKEIFNFLNKFIINQTEAKKQIAIAISQHYRKIKDPSIEKSNILIMGPTGTGKTEIARTVSKFLKVPFITADATSLTTRGYAGEDSDSIISRLLQFCNYDVSLAETGIVFIDEIDKLAKTQNNDSQISTVSVQQELLKIIEGTTIKVTKGSKYSGEEFFVNTKNILFICAGSFEGIGEIINNKRDKTITLNTNLTEDIQPVLNSKIDLDHLLQFGLIPEFVGRLPIIINTNPLTKEDMYQILTVPENSLIKQYKKLLSFDNIVAEFDDNFLKEIVDLALSKKLGARGIRKVLESHLKDLFFNIEDFSNSHIIIGKNIVKIRDEILLKNK